MPCSRSAGPPAPAVPTLVIDRPDALGNGDHAEEVMSLLPDGHLVVQPGIPDVLPFVGDVEAWLDAALGFLGGAIPSAPPRLMAVAATLVVDGTPVVTCHELPAQAIAAAADRLRTAGGRWRAVVHAGIVTPGGQPSGPAVAQALDALATAPAGTITRTPVVDALDTER